MRVRFQADADLDGRILRGLRRIAPGIDIRSAVDAALTGLEDPEVLRTASEIRTDTRQPGPPHYAGAFRSLLGRRSSPGVIMLREAIPISAAIEELILIWSASEAEEWIDRLVWIPL
jgi:hypothetical protein